MPQLLNSITKRLFFSLGFLLLNIIIVLALALSLFWRTSSVNNLTEKIEQTRLLTLSLLKTDLDFLRFETINSHYFETGESIYLNHRDSLSGLLESMHHELLTSMQAHDFALDSSLEDIEQRILRYNNTFTILEEKIREKGFKDFGMEGQMREHAHKLESAASTLALSNVLMLRRHEKDFLLRRESIYRNKLNNLVAVIKDDLKIRGQYEAAATISLYQSSFNTLTGIIEEIGINPTDGLQGKLNQEANEILEKLNLLSLATSERKESIMRQTIILFIVITITLTIASTALTFYTSVKLARPVKKLSMHMNKFMVNEGLNEQDLETNISNEDEISNLSQSFIKLSRKLKTQFNEIIQQNQELEKLNDELDRFIYSAAHDLKSPLASLDGLIHLAEKEINSPEHNHYFKMMSSSVGKLHSFILDITDYAKNKRQTVKVEPVDVAQMVDDIVVSLKFLPNANKINLTVNVHGGLLFTDKTRLEIVLKNLLANAYKYMDFTKTYPYIKVEGAIDPSCMRLTIVDNGIGIGNEHLSKVFDMFYRAVEHSKGTGIGLFLVKECVKMLRGRISVKSKLDEWTMFHMYLPNMNHEWVNAPESEGVVYEEAV
jgi:signal transduction histidine kinase